MIKNYICQDDLYIGCLFTFRGVVNPLLVVWMNKYCIFCVRHLEPHITVRIMYFDRVSRLTHLNQSIGTRRVTRRVTYLDLRTSEPCSRIDAYYVRCSDASYWPFVSLEAKKAAHAKSSKNSVFVEPLSIAS